MAEESPRIGRLEAGALASALAILDVELGDGLYGADDLEAAARDPSVLVLAAWQQEDLVAVAVGRVQIAEDADYYEAFGEDARRLFERGRVGSLEALAVLPRLRRRGLGAQLIRRRVEWFQEQGCASAIAIAWMPSNHPGGYSAPLFRELGFSEGSLVPEFYLVESARDGWSCPADGNPCRCGARLFWLDLPVQRG